MENTENIKNYKIGDYHVLLQKNTTESLASLGFFKSFHKEKTPVMVTFLLNCPMPMIAMNEMKDKEGINQVDLLDAFLQELHDAELSRNNK